MLEDPGCISTTMVDFYGLPKSSDRGWPGRLEASTLPFALRADFVEQAFARDLMSSVDVRRFVPFVVMHEFEGLLFSDCAAFSRAINRSSLAGAFEEIRRLSGSPEEINDSPETAPSKQIARLVPEYDKIEFGTLAALEIGLEKIRAECPHFDGWVRRLERLA